MKRNKGFIFIETLVVVAILSASLIMTYSMYSAAVVKENVRIHYNDSAFLYRTYYLQRFFRNFRLDLVASNLNQTDNRITGLNCYDNNALFMNSMNNQGLCESLFESLHIRNIYITYNDLSYVQECSNFSGVCEELGQLREEAVEFLKTIGSQGETGYRIVIEFEECKDGTYGDGNTCNNKYSYFYTTLSLGELL